MNPNSIDTYNKIKSNGLLSGRRFEVFECIQHWGPITASNVLDRLGLKTNNSGRFTELNEMGVIKPYGIKQNAAGHPETLWVTTGQLPTKLESEPTTLKDKALKAIERLSNNCIQSEKDELRRAWTIIKRLT